MAAPGLELCPHCQRPFKRLRAHLPHCKAAPRPPPAPGASPGPAPAAQSPAPGSGRGSGARPAPASAPGSALGSSPPPSPGPGTAPRSGPGRARSGSRAVRDVARSLDLHPEEVQDVPRKLEKGVKVVIEKHRARVVREKEPRGGPGAAGSRGQGTEPGRKSAQKSQRKDSRSQGALGNGAGSSKREKSSLKASKGLEERPESRNSPAELGRQEGRDTFPAGEERGQLEVGLGFKSPVPAPHPEKLHLSPLGGHGRGTSEKELGRPRDSAEQREAVPEPTRAPEPALLHVPKTQPACSSRASGSSAAGLEWFPDLYPDYEGLRIFPGKRFQEDVRIAVQTARGGFSQGRQGPLSERPLMEVRLGELHTWISTCSFTPQGLLGAVQKAWSSYCAKYMHVRQGGPAGISMLLAGYCLLSYGWNYQHFRQHRWRKYH